MRSNQKIKIIFLGSSSFGLPAFEALAKEPDFKIVLAVTQPDKPSGRKQLIVSSPIKQAAEKLGITVLQPENIMDIREKIILLKPDLIIVIAYAQLLPQPILDIPQYGCLNLHASLLPKYRGAAVVAAALLNRDEQTGLTVIKLDHRLDTGPILAQTKIDIAADETAGSLFNKLSALSPDFLINTVKRYLAGKITAWPQGQDQASYVKILTKADGLIDWSKPADQLERFVRAMSPWPSAWTWWRGKQVKILAAQNQPIEINSYKPGKTFKYNAGLAVQCGQDALIVKKLQLEGKNALISEEFLKGQKDFIGSVLG